MLGILEAGHIGWGASGRNGGFCSIGGAAGSVKDLVKRFGLSDVKAFYKSQVNAIELVKEIIIAYSKESKKNILKIN